MEIQSRLVVKKTSSFDRNLRKKVFKFKNQLK